MEFGSRHVNLSKKCRYGTKYLLYVGLFFDHLILTGVVALGGYLYVVGGDDGTCNLSSVEVYDPKTDTWKLLSSSLVMGRSYAGVAVIDKPNSYQQFS
jgi:hypothetical protein